MQNNKHTPLPWQYDYDLKWYNSGDAEPETREGIIIYSGEEEILKMGNGDAHIRNAAFIVEACNNHDRLKADVERLTEVNKDLADAMVSALGTFGAIRDDYKEGGAMRNQIENQLTNIADALNKAGR
jgi:hypothetical protein